MREAGSALIVGIVFGAGLALSDMINPARVLGFLDVAGHWDPTLVFAMIGAVIPTAVAFLIRGRLSAPLFGTEFFVPENRNLDRRLIAGAVLFGIGWGMVGFCPGPAISALSRPLWQPWLFVAAMLTGMAIERLLPMRLATRASSQTSESAI